MGEVIGVANGKTAGIVPLFGHLAVFPRGSARRYLAAPIWANPFGSAHFRAGATPIT
ncbi:hypothetical protein [Cupriavidus pauculus]|jgi:hypothetical protein|uniref:hypothetical protein n=1 Tax=Cupriavidus pauculus TaxID=82633 RepID=UPI0012FE6767|nr:hypothetical protein [Cupriavidus pauculus]MBY4728988.1 hypothetical protein [Cupriavidus pauculus]MCM3605291.1 hypothetical protein [Cupriavidus pauculus]UAK99740.1 hypothetical protein K8O84_17530 [Cupriavidus pauculus]